MNTEYDDMPSPYDASGRAWRQRAEEAEAYRDRAEDNEKWLSDRVVMLEKALEDIRSLLVIRPHRFADQTEKIHSVLDRALMGERLNADC